MFSTSSFGKVSKQLISLQSNGVLVPVLTDVDGFSLSTATVNSIVPPPVLAVFSLGYNFNCEKVYFTFSISHCLAF